MKLPDIKALSKWAGPASLGLLLSACASTDITSGPAHATPNGLAILPIANYSETPEAGQRARSLAQSILQQKGFTQLQTYPQEESTDLLLSKGWDALQTQGLEWARTTGAPYALTGAVQEWRYKVGLDGEPVVGLTFTLIDVSTGAAVWSSAGSQTGSSRSSLASVGQDLVRQMLAPLQPR